MKLNMLRLVKKQESEEHASAGFEMADVCTREAMEKFLIWDGTHGSLHLIKLVRYKQLPEYSDEMSL